MVDNLDSRLERFIQTYLDSFTAWDLISFFYYNPGVVDNLQGLAARLGRSAESVAEALEKLVEKGQVSKKGSPVEVYFYTPDEEFKELVELFNQAIEDRLLRLKILSLLLKKGVR